MSKPQIRAAVVENMLLKKTSRDTPEYALIVAIFCRAMVEATCPIPDLCKKGGSRHVGPQKQAVLIADKKAAAAWFSSTVASDLAETVGLAPWFLREIIDKADVVGHLEDDVSPPLTT